MLGFLLPIMWTKFAKGLCMTDVHLKKNYQEKFFCEKMPEEIHLNFSARKSLRCRFII